MTAIYKHPDGHEINPTPGYLTVTNADCADAVSVPIGGMGLRELGEHLISLSESSYTAADCAEQAGHAIGTNCLNEILAGRSQAEAFTVLQAALVNLQALDHPDRAAGGFAVAMVNVIEIGLQHLPKAKA
jgi:hypothetical protein